jgi:hypothetical protein
MRSFLGNEISEILWVCRSQSNCRFFHRHLQMAVGALVPAAQISLASLGKIAIICAIKTSQPESHAEK